jgi:hypothetical protein
MDVMDNGYISNGIPRFVGQIGLKYDMWNRKMKTCLQAQGYNVWNSIIIGYTGLKKPKNAAKK